MPKYLFTLSYTHGGVNGLLEVGGSHRSAALGQAVESLGGTVESFYYAFGENDAYVIAELPDDVAASALSLRFSAGGTITSKTTVLLDVTQVDEAAKREVSYKPIVR